MVGRENIDRSVFVGADMVPVVSAAYAIGHPGTVRSARPVIPLAVECRSGDRRRI